MSLEIAAVIIVRANFNYGKEKIAFLSVNGPSLKKSQHSTDKIRQFIRLTLTMVLQVHTP